MLFSMLVETNPVLIQDDRTNQSESFLFTIIILWKRKKSSRETARSVSRGGGLEKKITVEFSLIDGHARLFLDPAPSCARQLEGACLVLNAPAECPSPRGCPFTRGARQLEKIR